MFKLFFIFAVAIAVPVFFVFTWLTSAYHRLAQLRARVRKDFSEGRAGNEAWSNYERARRQFPTSLIAFLFRFGEVDARKDPKS